jgi:hypothetical protein
MVSTINFGTQFKRDLTKGRDYSQPFDVPEPMVINFSKEGMTDAELAEESQRLKNQANEMQYALQWLSILIFQHKCMKWEQKSKRLKLKLQRHGKKF